MSGLPPGFDQRDDGAERALRPKRLAEFAGQAAVTNVTSVLFSPGPSSFIQISAFDVDAPDAGVPTPATLALFAIGLVGLCRSRKKRRLVS